MRLSFDGKQVDCKTNISFPLTCSRISMEISLSENLETLALPNFKARFLVTSLASWRLALPVKTIRSFVRGDSEEGNLFFTLGTQYVAGEEGLEPSHAGIKIRCLNQLGYSPWLFFKNVKIILIKFFILNKYSYLSNFLFKCDCTVGYKNSETSPPRTAISLTIVPDMN